MNNIFWFVTGLLTGVACSLVVVPMWRAADAPKIRLVRRSTATVAAVLAFIALAVAIYRTTGRPDLLSASAGAQSASTSPATPTDAAEHADSLEVSVARLEQRLARGGGSPDDWDLLAKSYEFLGRPADAERARKHMIAGAPVPAAASSSGVAVQGTVSLDRALAPRVQAGDTLFIYAKAADSPGPPLAVWRTVVGAWPVSFKLDDSLSMLPTRKLSGFEKVIVEARISHSGQATRARGDLYGVSAVLKPDASKPLNLVISREVS